MYKAEFESKLKQINGYDIRLAINYNDDCIFSRVDGIFSWKYVPHLVLYFLGIDNDKYVACIELEKVESMTIATKEEKLTVIIQMRGL